MDYRQARYYKNLEILPVPITGSGILNSMINKLPFELHMPGYHYLGPGTKLQKRLERGDKPVNKLDDLAMQHDIAYSKSKNLNDRHAADYALQEGAWNRVLDRDAGLGEKTVAWLTTNAMKAKRALGAGLLTKFPVSIAPGEQEKLASAVKAKKSVTIKVNGARTKESVMNETYLPLTRSQISNLKKGGNRIRLSVAQVKKIKTGGFLPCLLAAAPVVAGVAGTLANIYNNKKANDRMEAERERHNKEMEQLQRLALGKGVYINKKPKGSGVYINKKPKGSGVYINKKPQGNGLLDTLLKKKKTLR